MPDRIKVSLYSNHPETFIKYFVTNLRHKHSIRGGHLVYWYGIQQVLHHQKAKKRQINSKGRFYKCRVGFLFISFYFATAIDSSKLQFANWTKFNVHSLKLKSIVNHFICTNKTTIFEMCLLFLTKNISCSVHDVNTQLKWLPINYCNSLVKRV